jgi:translation initiation factor 2 beta subunit (eIF-2beta)/eIF-5
MKYIIKESQYNNAIDKFITYQFEPHEEKTKKHSESIFWIKDGEVIAEIKESAVVWVSHQIWMNINVMFSLEYDETQQVIKDWLEEHYKLGGLTPIITSFS